MATIHAATDCAGFAFISSEMTFVSSRMSGLPLDRPRGVALSLQIERVTAGGGLKELEKRFRLLCEIADPIVFFGANHYHGLTALFHDTLWPL